MNFALRAYATKILSYATYLTNGRSLECKAPSPDGAPQYSWRGCVSFRKPTEAHKRRAFFSRGSDVRLVLKEASKTDHWDDKSNHWARVRNQIQISVGCRRCISGPDRPDSVSAPALHSKFLTYLQFLCNSRYYRIQTVNYGCRGREDPRNLQRCRL